jgi:hypothetical protein
MRVVIVLLGGLVLWAALLGIAKLVSGAGPFLHDHSHHGVCRHLVCRGCTEHVDWRVTSGLLVQEELPIFLLISVVPLVVAVFARWKVL